MDYKSFYIQYHENSMEEFFSNLGCSIYKAYVFNLDLTDEQDLINGNDFILNSFIPNESSLENMFDIKSPPQVSSILDFLLKTFNSRNPTLEDIRNFHYSEFIGWVFHTQEDNEIISKAINVFIYLFKADPELAANSDYIINHLSSKDINIVNPSINFLGELFISSPENGLLIIQNEWIIQQLLKLISIFNGSPIVCSNAVNLFSTILYYSLKYNFFEQFIQPQLIEKIVDNTLPYFSKFLANVTDAVLILYQIISTKLEMLLIALKKGLENKLIGAFKILSTDQMSSLYKIVRNIAGFCRQGQVKGNILKSIVFYEKTADLIKSKVDIETFDSIITTIDFLGIQFWKDFLKYDIIISLLSIIKSSSYETKKLICSILINIFRNADVSFRREFCGNEVLKLLFSMLDDDDNDDDFGVELISNLASILGNDTDHFLPIFIDLGYDQYLLDLTENEDPRIAELAQAELNTYNFNSFD